MVEKLGDICAVDWGNTALTKKSYVDGGEYLAVSATGGDGRLNHYEHEASVCVLSAIGAQCGKMFFPQQRFTAIKNTITLTPKADKVVSKFLYYLFTAIELPKRGAAQPFISKGDIQNFKVPFLPPLAEQQRIVAKLDAAFAEIDTAIEVAEAKEAEVEKLKSSLLSDLLSGETLLSGLTPITELCEAIYAGGDAPPKEKISKVETDEFSVPIYSNGAKGAGLYGFTSFEPRTLKPAITISARGTIGHIEMRTRPFLPIVRLIVLEPKTAKVNLTFLKYALLNTEVFGSGSSIPQLTVPMLKKMNIVSPPLAEQQRIVAKLEAAFAEIDNAKQAIQRAKENHAALKSAILAQELTPPTESEAA
jgi:type I restriction enzyme S subunit